MIVINPQYSAMPIAIRLVTKNNLRATFYVSFAVRRSQMSRHWPQNQFDASSG